MGNLAPEAKRPEVFALMRNAHEVIRGAVRDLDAALGIIVAKEGEAEARVDAKVVDQKGALDRFRAQWPNFMRFMRIHTKMEEGAGTAEGVFAMLDRLDGSRTKEADLLHEHAPLAGLERAVERSLGMFGSYKKVMDAYRIFKEVNEKHMKKEEAIMMPGIKKLSDKGINLRDAMRESVLAAISPDEKAFFISYALEKLERHPEGMPRTRVFVHALSAVADSQEEWDCERALVQSALSPAEYQKVCAEVSINAFGEAAYPPGKGPVMAERSGSYCF